MELISCPHCGTQVVLSKNGRCPSCRKLCAGEEGPSDESSANVDEYADADESPQTELEIIGDPVGTVVNRFSSMIPLLFGAALMWWFFISAGIGYLLIEHFGLEKKTGINAAAAAGAMITVSGLFLCLRYGLTAISSSQIRVDQSGMSIRAMQRYGLGVYQFKLEDLEAIVYGDRLSGAEKLYHMLNRANLPQFNIGQFSAAEKAGRLFIKCKSGKVVTFNYLNKAFDDKKLLQLFKVLDYYKVPIETGMT